MLENEPAAALGPFYHTEGGDFDPTKLLEEQRRPRAGHERHYLGQLQVLHQDREQPEDGLSGHEPAAGLLQLPGICGVAAKNRYQHTGINEPLRSQRVGRQVRDIAANLQHRGEYLLHLQLATEQGPAEPKRALRADALKFFRLSKSAVIYHG